MQVCLNGNRRHHPAPLTPAEMAESARAAVAAGALDIHLHPKRPDGTDTLEPDHVARAVEAVRAAVPGIPVGVTTGVPDLPDHAERADLIRAWPVLPDHASVNWHRDGAHLVAEALLERGIGIEAGLFSGTDAVHRFQSWPHADRVLRILAEVQDADPSTPHDLLRRIGPSGPVLLHGEEEAAWPVLRLALSLGLATRIGLEDTLLLPDGTPAADNAALIRQALTIRAA